MLGIKEKYRQLGLPMLAFHHIYEIVRKKEKYRYMEIGWTLEDNEAVNSLIEEAGAKMHKNTAYSTSLCHNEMNGFEAKDVNKHVD